MISRKIKYIEKLELQNLLEGLQYRNNLNIENHDLVNEVSKKLQL